MDADEGWPNNQRYSFAIELLVLDKTIEDQGGFPASSSFGETTSCVIIDVHEVPGLSLPQRQSQATIEPLLNDTERVFVDFYSRNYHELGLSTVTIQADIAEAAAAAKKTFTTLRRRLARELYRVCLILENRATCSRRLTIFAVKEIFGGGAATQRCCTLYCTRDCYHERCPMHGTG